MKEYYVLYHCFSRDGDDIQDATIEAESEQHAKVIAKTFHRARHVISVSLIRDYQVRTDKINITVKGTSTSSVLQKISQEHDVRNHKFLTIKTKSDDKRI